jgi:hypothetical protein
MFAKATIFAILAVAARVAVATPPACLLAAVNECPNPADIKSICSNDSSKVTSYISKNCGEHEDAASKYFKEVCEDAGETISAYSSSSSASKSGSKTASATGSLSTASGNSSDTDSSMTITGASTFATGVSGAASGTGSNGISATNNGTVTTAGTAGPTTTGNAGTSPTNAAGSDSAASEGSAARMGMEAAGLAAIGVVGAMLVM